jgi:hypothetical protein
MSESFATALLNPDLPPPTGLCAWNGSDPSIRFAVYRNNVIVSLVDALADSFPVVQMLVGETFFRAMAREFAYQYPPRSPVLTHYGADFPEFIGNFQPASSLPYLADVARLEYAYIQAYHAAEAPVLSASQFSPALTQPENLPRLRMRLLPSAVVLCSPYAMVSLWAAHQMAEVASLPDPNQPEAVLIVRPELEVKVSLIDAGTHTFIHALQNDTPLGEAAGLAMETQADFDLTQALTLLIRERVINSLTT